MTDEKKTKTNVNVKVCPKIYKQFVNLAGFLNPGIEPTEARNKLLNEAMEERINKENL